MWGVDQLLYSSCLALFRPSDFLLALNVCVCVYVGGGGGIDQLYIALFRPSDFLLAMVTLNDLLSGSGIVLVCMDFK